MKGYENYDLQEEDPYLIPGSTCLLNNLGITDTHSLTEAEAEISAVATAGLVHTPVTPSFDFDHLCEIHRRLFGEVYPWAGSCRKTEIGKGGKLFLPWKLIEEESSKIFAELHQENLLQGLSQDTFVERAAYYFGRVNAVHAFREGNGRTQRIFLDQLAYLSGYEFSWQAVSGEQMAQACRDAREEPPCYKKLMRLLNNIIIVLDRVC